MLWAERTTNCAVIFKMFGRSRNRKMSGAAKQDASKKSSRKKGAPNKPPAAKSAGEKKRSAGSQVPSTLSPNRQPPGPVARGSSDRSARSAARAKAPPIIPEAEEPREPEVTIKDIKVSAVTLDPKGATFMVSLNNCAARIPVRTDQTVWRVEESGGDTAMAMKDKMRGVIQSKRDAHNIQFSTGVGYDFMLGNDWPWKCLWLQVESEMLRLQTASKNKSNSSEKGHVTRNESLQLGEWVRGPDFKDNETHSRAMRRAKSAVIAELEKGSKKNLTKAETILSAVVTELSDDHGLKENRASPSSSKAKQIIDGASAVIKSLSRSATVAAATLLTGIVC